MSVKAFGLVPGRSGAAGQTWLAAQPQSWREGIEVVALDPSAPFAAAIRRALPHATLASWSHASTTLSYTTMVDAGPSGPEYLWPQA